MLKIVWTGFLRCLKRRKNLTFVLVFSYVILVFFMSFFTQMDKNVRNFWVDKIVGGNIVTSADNDYFDFYTPTSLSNSFSYDNFIQHQDPDRALFSPRLRTSALLEKTSEIPMIVIGIDQDSEVKLGNHISLEEGRWCEPGKNEIMLSYASANTIGATLGDELYFTVLTKDGYPSYEKLTVTGYLSFGNIGALFGDNIAYMPVDVLRSLCSLESDSVNEVLTNATSSMRLHLDGRYQLYDGENMLEYSRLVRIALMSLRALLLVLFGCFLLQNISLNIIMMMEERYREISVYLTFGANPAWIRGCIYFELLLYTGYCALIGSVLGSVAILGFNCLGIYSMDAATEMLLSSAHFVIHVFPSVFFTGFAILIFLVFAGAFITVRKSTSLLSIRKLFE